MPTACNVRVHLSSDSFCMEVLLSLSLPRCGIQSLLACFEKPAHWPQRGETLPALCVFDYLVHELNTPCVCLSVFCLSVCMYVCSVKLALGTLFRVYGPASKYFFFSLLS